MELIRGLVRPSLTWLFTIPFIFMAIYSLVKWGTAEIALGIITAFVAMVSSMVSAYFIARALTKPPVK